MNAEGSGAGTAQLSRAYHLQKALRRKVDAIANAAEHEVEEEEDKASSVEASVSKRRKRLTTGSFEIAGPGAGFCVVREQITAAGAAPGRRCETRRGRGTFCLATHRCTKAAAAVHRRRLSRHYSDMLQRCASLRPQGVLPLLCARQTGLVPSATVEAYFSRPWSTRMRLCSSTFRNGHMSSITSLDMDYTECRYLLSGGADSKICVYDTASKIAAQASATTIPGSSNIWSSSAAGETVIRHPSRFAAVDLTAGQWKACHRGPVTALQWYPFDTGLCVSGSKDGTTRVWDMNALHCVVRFPFMAPVNTVGLSRPATSHCLVAVGTSGKDIRLCDILSGAFTHSLLGHQGEVTTLNWSPASEYILVSGSTDRTIRLWDIRKASGCLGVLDEQRTTAVPAARRKLSASDTVTLERPCSHPQPQRQRHMPCQSHRKAVAHVQFSRDGQQIISSAMDGRLRSWDTLEQRNTLVHFDAYNPSGLNKFCVMRDHRHIVFPTDHALSVLRIADGQLVASLTGAHFGAVVALECHSVREEIYTAGADGSTAVWNAEWQPVVAADDPQADSNADGDGDGDGDGDAWSDEDGDGV